MKYRGRRKSHDVASQRRDRPVGRWAALFGGLAFGLASLGQLADATHGWVVEHATCPEHGEILHADPHAVADGHASERHPEATRGPGVHANRNSGADAHDHCRIGVDRRGFSVAPGTASGRLPASLKLATPKARERLAPSIALYRLAPKSSPPA